MQYSLLHAVSYVTHISTLALSNVFSSSTSLVYCRQEENFSILVSFLPQDITLIDIFNSRDAFHQLNKYLLWGGVATIHVHSSFDEMNNVRISMILKVIKNT